MRHNVAQYAAKCSTQHYTGKACGTLPGSVQASGRQVEEIFLKYSGVWKWRISGAENKRSDFHRNRHDSKTGGGANISSKSIER